MVKRRMWLAEPLSPEVERALRRLEKTGDVVRMAVMPDVHLARDVCIGTVAATRTRVFPNAVGGDIGCGMCAVSLGVEAARLEAPNDAAAVLAALYRSVPIVRHRPRDAPSPSARLMERLSSSLSLRRCRREARMQLGTLGRGNHFVELQADEAGGLWAMVHSGSRGMGQAIREHHLRRARPDTNTGVAWLSTSDADGQSYLQDVAWARAYAVENRARIMHRVVAAVADAVGARPLEETWIDVDHNHVAREHHAGEPLLVHRKGAQAAREGEPGIVPGSMGTSSFHVRGRGDADSLCSSSHGAGRAMSRTEARQRISRRRLARDTVGVFYDHRLRDRLREEAPTAYKDIDRVMRAQRDLVRVVRRLRPVLVFKGG
ncbi:MAG: RtcB family protein [Sandaracinaceae bacterium]